MAAPLVASMRTSLASAGTHQLGSEAVRTRIADLVSSFPIAPDADADLKRLPESIKDLATLKEWLTRVQNLRDTDLVTAKADGTIRTYKNIVMAIHAVSVAANSGKLDAGSTMANIVKEVCEQAKNDKPEGLSKGAETMWTNSFTGKCTRIGRAVALVVHAVVS